MRFARILFYLFLISIPFGTRHLLYQTTPGFHEYEAIFLYGSDIITILFLAAWCWPKVSQNKFKLNRVTTPFLIFLASAVLSVFWAASRFLTLYNLSRLLIVIVLACAIGDVLKDKKILKWSLVILIAGALAQSLIGLAQFKTQSSVGLKILGESPISATDMVSSKIVVGGTRFLRAYGTFPHPNVLAAFLVLGLIAIYYFWLKNFWLPQPDIWKDYRKAFRSYQPVFWRTIVLAIALFIVFLGLALTFSRAAWLIAIFISLFTCFISLFSKTYRRPALKLIVTLSAIVYLFVIILRPFIVARAEFAAGEPAVALRVTYNNIGLALIRVQPLGVGIGNQVWYAVTHGVYKNFGLDQSWQWQPIHNLYLLIAVEIGIPGLLAFLVFLGTIIINSKSQYLNPKQITNNNYLNLKRFEILNFKNWNLFGVWSLEFGISIIMLIALLLFGLTDHFLWTLEPGRLMLWLVIGITLALKSRNQ